MNHSNWSKEDMTRVAGEVICEVLQKYTFLFTDPVDKTINDEDIGKEVFSCIQMKFEGPVQGRFSLILSKKACRAITANILGFEESDSFVQNNFNDGAKELLNIVGSHFLTQIAGDRVEFNLSVPEASDCDSSRWKKFYTDKKTVLIKGDEQVLLFGVEAS